MQATLNVKTAKEAAAFGAALFDLSDEYRYVARKLGKNSYSLIAYNPDTIARKLQTLPNGAVVEKFTFAQWVFAQEEDPIRLENGKLLTILEGIVIEIDSSYFQSDHAIALKEALAKPHYFLQSLPLEVLSSPTITPKTVKTTLLLLILILGNLTATTVLNYQEIGRLESLKEEILDREKLPETSFERDALISSLEKKEKAQLRLREQFLPISDLSIHANVPPLPTAPLPQTPPTTAPLDGIVLIPGSKPGEANQLLVNGAANAPAPSAFILQGEGIEEIVYDGRNIKMRLNASDTKAKEELKKAILKSFKKAKISEQGHSLEVWIP